MKARIGLFVAIFALAAHSAWAKDNWWTGATDNNWNTGGNWESSGGGNDNRKFGGTESSGESKFNNLFKNTYDYTVYFTNQVTSGWKVHIRSGTQAHPIVFEADSAANGLTVGHSTDTSGYYIGYDNSTDNQAWLKLKRGTWDTNTGGCWQVGKENSSTGHLIVCDGATVKCSKDFYVYQGSVDVEGGAIKVNSNQVTRVYAAGSINLNGGMLITKHIADLGGSEIVFNGGTLKANNTYTDKGGLIEANIAVKVTGGGTIDNGGHNIKIGAALGVSGDTRGLKFTGGGTTRLEGAVNYSGATSVAPGTILAVANETAKNNILANGLVVAGVPTANQTVFTYTSAFADADLQKVSCSLAPTTTFKFSDEGKTNIVVDVVGPQLDNYWTGAAGDNNLNTPGNWSGNVVPGAEHNVGINVDSETTLTCDTAFSVNSITFPATSAKVTITGAGSITNATTIVNNASSRHVIGVPVEFKSGDDYAQINVTGEVDFQGGVKGTLPANHSKFYGKYTLTEAVWEVSSPITLAADATVDASGTTLKEVNKTTDGMLCSEEGARIVLASIERLTNKGDIFGDFAGEVVVGLLKLDKCDWYRVNANFTGRLRVGYIYMHSTSANNYFRIQSNGEFVLGRENGDSGIKTRQGTFNLRESDATEPLVLHSAADWNMISEKPNGTGYGFDIPAQGVAIDTSDFDGAAAGHTVAIKKSGNPTRVLSGVGWLSCFGNGTLRFETSCEFTGGLTASNGVTLVVNKGVNPGQGNVTLDGTATLDLAQAASGTVPVAGTLTMAGGTTIHIPTYTVGVLPLSVNALAFDSVTDVSKVVLDIEGGTLETGYYPIIGSTTALPEGVEANFALSLGEDVVPNGTSASLCVEGDVIYLLVGDGQGLRSGVWSGRGGDNNLSNPANWENITVPSAGDALDFSGVTSAATVNGDMNATFGAVTMGTGVITFTGALKATSFTDTSKVAVGENSTVTLDGNLVFSGSSNQYVVNTVAAGGRFVVTGRIEASSQMTGGQVFQYVNPGEGAVQANGLLANEGTSDEWTFRLSSDKDGTANWIVGADGLSGSKYFFAMNNSNRKAAIQPLDSDFTIATKVGIRAPLTLNTTGYYGARHTITVSSIIDRDGALTVSGKGTVLVDAVNTHSGGITVTDTATLAINAGKVATTGSITVKTNATLQVAQSAASAGIAAVTLGGGLTLKNGAALGFNYTNRNAPKLDLTDKTVTFDEGPTTNVVVKISATAGKRGFSGNNVLTAGGQFTGVTVTLASGAPDWALGVDVKDGEIVLNVKPMPMLIIVR